jgi:hypothetical protein
MSKQTAVEWLTEKIETQREKGEVDLRTILHYCEKAKAMEREQMEKTFSKEEVIAIVRKSIATGLTAEYLILALKGGDNHIADTNKMVCEHMYSRTMNQPYPRKCIKCKQIEGGDK